MLKLQLTDGDQELFAIEYEPIRCLHSNMALQSKLLIKGLCRCFLYFIFCSLYGIPRSRPARIAVILNIERTVHPIVSCQRLLQKRALSAAGKQLLYYSFA